MSLDTLPEILTAEHMAKYLGMSRRVIYDLMKTKPEAGGIVRKAVNEAQRYIISCPGEWDAGESTPSRT